MKRLLSGMLLVLAAFIWGAAFSAQSASTEFVGPFTFNASRFLIGGIVLIPVSLITERFRKKKRTVEIDSSLQNSVKPADGFAGHLKAGIICGIVVAAASSFQQIGMALGTPPGKAGFITALYVILVPICEIFLTQGMLSTWVSALLAVAGMYLLSMSGESIMPLGDLMEVLCSLGFTIHILVIDRLTPRLNGVTVSCIQFLTAGVLCTIITLFTESVSLSALIDCAGPILYAGICSCGIAYTLQIIGQKNTKPVVASLLLSLESVFSVIAAWLVLGETLTGREIAGCCIVFAAIILAQLPAMRPKKEA